MHGTNLIIFFVALSAVAMALKPITKLQIGVKKRPDTCLQKSKQGDTLSIHYSVSYCRPRMAWFSLCFTLSHSLPTSLLQMIVDICVRVHECDASFWSPRIWLVLSLITRDAFMKRGKSLITASLVETLLFSILDKGKWFRDGIGDCSGIWT